MPHHECGEKSEISIGPRLSGRSLLLLAALKRQTRGPSSELSRRETSSETKSPPVTPTGPFPPPPVPARRREIHRSPRGGQRAVLGL